jgi:hypothetical protein
MQIRRYGFALGLALVSVTACGDDANAPGIRAPREFAMNAVNGNGVTGTVRIEDDAGTTSTVTVSLEGLEPGSQHAGHVHTGSCANQGAIVAGLDAITADAEGEGSATTADVLDDRLGDAFYIQYHVALNPPGAPLSCADIPAPAPPVGGGGY